MSGQYTICAARKETVQLCSKAFHNADVPKLAQQYNVHAVGMKINHDARPHECMESKRSEHC